MAGVGGLKKSERSVIPDAATSPEADAFISGAKVDGKNGKSANAVPAARQKIWKPVTFSLTTEINEEINRMVDLGSRQTRSDVVRVALVLLAEQGDAKVSELLRCAKARD